MNVDYLNEQGTIKMSKKLNDILKSILIVPDKNI